MNWYPNLFSLYYPIFDRGKKLYKNSLVIISNIEGNFVVLLHEHPEPHTADCYRAIYGFKVKRLK